jgi:hypothetical protein
VDNFGLDEDSRRIDTAFQGGASMLRRLLNLLSAVLLLIALVLSGCWSAANGINLSPPPGPELNVTAPQTIIGGQPSHWVFNWSKGKGAPYLLTVELSNEVVGSVTWEESDIADTTIEHDFVLPNSGNSSLTYHVWVRLSDRYGPSNYYGFFPTYDGSDEVEFSLNVLPGP